MDLSYIVHGHPPKKTVEKKKQVKKKRPNIVSLAKVKQNTNNFLDKMSNQLSNQPVSNQLNITNTYTHELNLINESELFAFRDNYHKIQEIVRIEYNTKYPDDAIFEYFKLNVNENIDGKYIGKYIVKWKKLYIDHMDEFNKILIRELDKKCIETNKLVLRFETDIPKQHIRNVINNYSREIRLQLADICNTTPNGIWTKYYKYDIRNPRKWSDNLWIEVYCKNKNVDMVNKKVVEKLLAEAGFYEDI